MTKPGQYVRDSKGMNVRETGQVLYICPYCGRTWLARTKGPGDDTGWTGFLSATVNVHSSRCKQRTPQERIESAKADQKRWRKRPLLHTIVRDTPEYGGASSDDEQAEGGTPDANTP